MKLFFLLSALFIFSLYPHPMIPFKATVTDVTDGYCIELVYDTGEKESARLAYIQPIPANPFLEYDKDSITAFISKMLKGKKVNVVDSLGRDADNRLPVKISVDSIADFNGYLIQKRYARASRKGTPGFMYNKYSKYQDYEKE